MEVMVFSGGLVDSFTKPKCWDLTLPKVGCHPMVMFYDAYPLVDIQKAIENGH
jgi:hypothetical protein